MAKKKVKRTFYNVLDLGKDVAFNQLLMKGNVGFGLTIYQIVSTNPMQIAIGILALKLGVTNKIVIALIVAFLL